jgi:hypothetical protein
MTTEKKKKKLSRSAADAATVIPRAPLFSFLAFPRPFLDAVERGTMCSRASAWLLVEPRCRTVLAGTRFHSAPFSCAVALFFLLVLPCSFFLLFPSLSLCLSLSLLLRSVLQPLSSSHCRERRRACTRKGRKKKKSEAAEREEIGKGRKSRFLFFFLFLVLSLLSSPLPSLRPTNHQPTTGLARRGRQGRRRGRQGRRRGRERRRRPRRRGSRLRGRQRARRGRSRPGGRGQGPDVAARRAFPGDQPVEALLHAVQRVLPMRGAEGRGGRGVQIREFVVFGFWNFLGEREKKKKKKTRGRKKLTSLSLLSILQQRQRKQQQYQRAYRSICPSEWLEKWAEQREAGKSFPLLPPPFFQKLTTTTGSRERVPNNSYLTRSLFHLDCTTTTKNASSQQVRTPASTRWLV